MLTTIQQFASALGIAGIGGVLFAYLTAVDRAGHAHALALTAGINSGLMVIALGFALALVAHAVAMTPADGFPLPNVGATVGGVAGRP